MTTSQASADSQNSETRTVEVLFDPSRIPADPFSFVPERVELDCGRETEIELVLTTRGGQGRRASFPESDFVTWDQDAGAIFSEAILDPGKIRARLRLSPRSADDAPGPYPYHVRAEYDGRLYRSTGYPVSDLPPAC